MSKIGDLFIFDGQRDKGIRIYNDALFPLANPDNLSKTYTETLLKLHEARINNCDWSDYQ